MTHLMLSRNFHKLYLSSSRYASAKVTSALEGIDRAKLIDGGLSKNVQDIKTNIEEFDKMVSEATARFNENYEVYYGKDRDFVNFPTLKQPEYHPKVRMGFLPDSWFQAFYDKSGVLGPYFLLFGAVNFLISKEYWVVDHEFKEIPMAVGAMLVLANVVFPKILPKLKELEDKVRPSLRDQPLAGLEAASENMLANIAEIEENKKATPITFDVKRENVDLQLELNYRQRIQEFNSTIKQRLDYQVAKLQAKRAVEQEHMVDWINQAVVKAITPQQEKEALAQCIKDLKSLAQQHKTSGVRITSA